jgi:hypothetical protein
LPNGWNVRLWIDLEISSTCKSHAGPNKTLIALLSGIGPMLMHLEKFCQMVGMLGWKAKGYTKRLWAQYQKT